MEICYAHKNHKTEANPVAVLVQDKCSLEFHLPHVYSVSSIDACDGHLLVRSSHRQRIKQRRRACRSRHAGGLW